VENEIVHDWDAVQQRYEDARLDLLNDVRKTIPALIIPASLVPDQGALNKERAHPRARPAFITHSGFNVH
jgi:hypothetical protein